ncbi:acyltransferase family protein [Streptococcus loxodontisalivarius]|uniref:Peptidoglycan/LPS O-acetylase OafA/YrhL n=1 Tax=Streptococcus loxodontisalivarius TaxID=1349415 RepID=A0ABS2PTF1_9STRE|nr:acyltransferase family protein [Streptococcus loxodontisalivarius]MBM7643193.1 peptidoglycan/LPS O-acetylase OafA/YrhL [Streptococcus loxodontisalivarius]
MRIKWFSLVRITGLLLVLLYHFFKTSFPGGFIGVDVFFTFSGYLITALMIDEYTRSKAFDFLGYLKRRFYRIVPPLVLMVLLTIPFTFLVRNDFRAGIGGQMAAALGFTTNLYEIFTGSSYESQFIPHLFVHTWSLAIEVHFYLIWGLIIWLLSKRDYSKTQFRGLIFLISAVFFGIGFVSMFARAFFTSNFSLLYFSTLSHSFPFYLGAMFATTSGIVETTARFKKNVRLWSAKRAVLYMAGSFALLLLLTFVLDFNQLLTYLFGFALSSLFASTMIYAARVLHEKTENVSEPKWISFLADTSYGVYLFHWPFYVIFSQITNNLIAVFLTLVFSYLFTSLSFYIVEPLLVGKKPSLLGLSIDFDRFKKPFGIIMGILAALALVTAALAPKMGSFEESLLVNSLNQADTNITQTNNVTAGDATALSSILIIGDSVTLRSSTAFASDMSEATLDAAVSRNFTEAYDIFKNHIDNGTLPSTVVIAVGVNSTSNYEEATKQFVDALPDGHRLVFVSPYNSKNLDAVKAVRDYEADLASEYSYVTLADWYTAAIDNPDIWAGTDGVHYSDATTTGAELYVKTVQDAVTAAAKKNAKGS